MSKATEQSTDNPVFQANAITVELPRAWFDVPRDVHRDPLGIPPYAHGIYDAVAEIEGVKAIYAVADNGYIPHQGLNIVALDESADAQKIRQSIIDAVERVTLPTYGYSKSAVSHFEASKARVSTAVVQSSHGQFPFNGEEAPFATTYLSRLNDRENPIGEAGRLINAFDGGLGNMEGNMAVIHQFVQSGTDPETEQATGHTIIRGLIQIHGDMDEAKARFHTATRQGLGGLGYDTLAPHRVLPVEGWPDSSPNA